MGKSKISPERGEKESLKLRWGKMKGWKVSRSSVKREREREREGIEGCIEF